MLGLRHVLASPRRLSPEHAALATIAALTAAATPPVVASIPDAASEIAGHPAALPIVACVTASLATGLASRALRARSAVRARLWLVFGAAFAGTLATVISFWLVAMIYNRPLEPYPSSLFTGSILGGGALGFVFGTAFAPTVATAHRALRKPSHDGLDRVVLTGGATLLAFGLVRRLLPASLPGAFAGDAAVVAGALAVAVAATRIAVRIRLLARAREGGEPGFHVVPLSGNEDEAALLPLVRTPVAPAGVLAATGVSAPYRGARGIFKLALAPLPEQRSPSLVAHLLREVMTEGGHVLLTLAIGGMAAVVLSPILVVVAVAGW